MTQEAINKVVRNGQVTIPAKIRMAMNLHDGDWIRLSFENNKLIITPVSIIDKDQAYIFSPKWQKAIQESEKDIQRGEFSTYRSVKDLKKDMEND